ncbi:MAG: class I SAM-dependent methyltransferase [Candidatus Riflebacteria bacterium]|nr:class I SAM-dependent methyltransferase [Candidatus Riflebacteria bacterium]
MQNSIKSILFQCPTCEKPFLLKDLNFCCPKCLRVAKYSPELRRFDFQPFLNDFSTLQQERTSFAYSIYSLIYAPIALLNLIAVWHGSLGKQIRHYSESFQKSHGPILDVAIGDGALTVLSLAKFAQKSRKPCHHPLLGLDISLDMLSKAEKNLSKIKNFVSIRADARNLPFSSGSFNQVFCYGGFHSIPLPEKAMKEIFRVLEPNGRLRGSVLLTPNRPISGALIRKYVEWGSLSTNFTRFQFLSLLKKAGFRLISTESNGSTLLFEAYA